MDEQPFRAVADGDTLVLSGVVDAEGIARMREEVARHSAGHTQPLVVDLSAVTYLPSLGVAVLTRALGASRRQGASLDLVARSGSMAERVLSLVGLPHRSSEEV